MVNFPNTDNSSKIDALGRTGREMFTSICHGQYELIRNRSGISSGKLAAYFKGLEKMFIEEAV